MSDDIKHNKKFIWNKIKSGEWSLRYLLSLKPSGDIPAWDKALNDAQNWAADELFYNPEKYPVRTANHSTNHQQVNARKSSRAKAKRKKNKSSKTVYTNRTSVTNSKQTYYGSNARIFDHRARPSVEPHSGTDQMLDKNYFKNSK